MTIESGKRYILVNKESDTVVDLDTRSKTVQCWSQHEGANQRWDFTQVEGGWHIQNAEQRTYLSFEGNPQDGKRIECLSQPYVWHIWPDKVVPDAYRICVPGTVQNLDLDRGCEADGTLVQLWSTWEGKNQVWAVVQV